MRPLFIPLPIARASNKTHILVPCSGPHHIEEIRAAGLELPAVNQIEVGHAYSVQVYAFLNDVCLYFNI